MDTLNSHLFPHTADPFLPAQGGFRAHRFATPQGSLNGHLYTPPLRQRQGRLVVMLHGCTQDALDFARATGMNQIARERGWFVLYPEQSRQAHAQGCWQWFEPAHRTRHAGEAVNLVAVIRHVLATYDLDASRTCVGGLSAGGAMAAALVSAWPELFAGAAVHSGLPPALANTSAEARSAMRGELTAHRRIRFEKPLIVFHGTADPVVHPVNGECLYRAAEKHLQAAGVGRSLERRSLWTTGGRRVSLRSLVDADGRSLCEYWSIEGAGHAWSGGNPTARYADPFGPNASREMARFFAHH